MKLNEILERLDDCTIEAFSREDLQVNITGIKMIIKDQKIFLPNILYFGHVSKMPPHINPDYCINFICYGDIRIAPVYDRGTKLNLLSIDVLTDELFVYNKLQEIFLETQQVVAGMRFFLDALYSDIGLKGIADVAYGVLGNPLYVVDTSFRYLAISSGTIANNELMEQENALGRIDDEGIALIRRIQLDDKVRKSDRPFYFMNPVHHTGMLVGSIQIHGIEVGHVMVYEMNKPFTDNDYELTQRLCRIVSIEMQKDDFYKKNKGIMYTYFLAELLDDTSGDFHNVKDRLSTLGYTLRDNLYVLTISPQNNITYESKMEIIVSDLQRIIPNSLYVIYKNTVVLLINCYKEENLEGYAYKELYNYLKHNSLIAGISNNFMDIQDMKRYYEQSLKAAQIGYRLREKYGFYKYEDMSIFHIMELCEMNGYNLWDYCHPALPKLITYDKQKNTDFLDTLYQYLNYSRNTMMTANHLHIHKNTLLYRMEKIKKIIGNSLEHGDEMIKLHFSFKILEYLKVI